VPITATASSTSISDAVSSSNSANIYKFNLAQRSSLNLLASGLSADVNMAIGETLKGSVPTDGAGNPLTKSQLKKLRKQERSVENFEKPEGDATTMREDIEKLANDTNSTIEVRQSDEGVVRILDLPSGQEARTYPKSKSGKRSPTLEIDLRRKGSIKIRYTKGLNQRATIVIPTA
jgi:hypothetical protein